jgi:hypothetical protein
VLAPPAAAMFNTMTLIEEVLKEPEPLIAPKGAPARPALPHSR